MPALRKRERGPIYAPTPEPSLPPSSAAAAVYLLRAARAHGQLSGSAAPTPMWRLLQDWLRWTRGAQEESLRAAGVLQRVRELAGMESWLQYHQGSTDILQEVACRLKAKNLLRRAQEAVQPRSRQREQSAAEARATAAAAQAQEAARVEELERWVPAPGAAVIPRGAGGSTRVGDLGWRDGDRRATAEELAPDEEEAVILPWAVGSSTSCSAPVFPARAQGWIAEDWMQPLSAAIIEGRCFGRLSEIRVQLTAGNVRRACGRLHAHVPCITAGTPNDVSFFRLSAAGDAVEAHRFELLDVMLAMGASDDMRARTFRATEMKAVTPTQAAGIWGQAVHVGVARLACDRALSRLRARHWSRSPKGRSVRYGDAGSGGGIFAMAMEEACAAQGVGFRYVVGAEAHPTARKAHQAMWAGRVGLLAGWADEPETQEQMRAQGALTIWQYSARCNWLSRLQNGHAPRGSDDWIVKAGRSLEEARAVFQYARDTQPLVIILEQVTDLLAVAEGSVWAAWKRLLHSLGEYEWEMATLDPRAVTESQASRDRLWIIGVRAP